MVSQPGLEKFTMAHHVQRRDHNVQVPHLVRLHLYLGDIAHPRGPLPDGDLVVDDREVARREGDGGGGVLVDQPISSHAL